MIQITHQWLSILKSAAGIAVEHYQIQTNDLVIDLFSVLVVVRIRFLRTNLLQILILEVAATVPEGAVIHKVVQQVVMEPRRGPRQLPYFGYRVLEVATEVVLMDWTSGHRFLAATGVAPIPEIFAILHLLS